MHYLILYYIVYNIPNNLPWALWTFWGKPWNQNSDLNWNNSPAIVASCDTKQKFHFVVRPQNYSVFTPCIQLSHLFFLLCLQFRSGFCKNYDQKFCFCQELNVFRATKYMINWWLIEVGLFWPVGVTILLAVLFKGSSAQHLPNKFVEIFVLTWARPSLHVAQSSR